MNRRDWLDSLDAAVKTTGAIGLLLVAYVVTHGLCVALYDINHWLYEMGAALAAAANGSAT